MKRTWALVVSLFFLTVLGNTQTLKTSGGIETASNSAAPVSFADVSNAEMLPVAPSKLAKPLEGERAANKTFWIVNAYQFLWTVADIESTAFNLNKSSTCREMNPLVGSRPSRATLYLSNLPVMVGAGYLSYRSRTKHGKYWYLLPSIAGSAHAAGTVWNMTGSSC